MKTKVTIIGAGMVGSTIAYSLVLQDIVDEITLVDLNTELADSQVMDLQHSVPFVGRTTINSGSYADCSDSQVTVITCGAAQQPGESRLALVQRNASIVENVVAEVFVKNPESVLIMVTNPVDVLTHLVVKKYPQNKNKIMGTGTILDSARFRHLLGAHLDIDNRSIHAYILGEHGDSEFPVWSGATIGNMRLLDHRALSDTDKERIFEDAKNAAYTIIEGKQSTYYAIGAGCAHLIRAIVRNRKSVLSVSHLIEGIYGVEDVCLSMPVVVGQEGIVERLEVDLSKEEQELLQISAAALKAAAAEIML